MPTYPLTTLAAQVTPTGISAPSFNDILASLQASFQAIYGSDAVLTPDSQDGQLLAVFAAAINDSNQTALAVYNSFPPSFSQGAALSAMVKINGIARQVASNSTTVLTIVGVAGTVITGGIAKDANGYLWGLVGTVIIPSGGAITVNAICQTLGAINAPAGTITIIFTPTPGWQTVINANDAVIGNPVETDAALRQRQAISVALPAQTPAQAILAAVANVAGVGRHVIYDNDTGAPDSNGVPAHSISVVVEGGDATAIATAIEQKKTLGTGTYGSTTINITDQAGVTIPINFYVLAYTQIYVSVTIKALTGYVSSTQTAIQQAIVDFINSLSVGEDVYYAWLYGPAGLAANPTLQPTFKITALTSGTAPSPAGTADIVIAFNAAATCQLSNVVITVT